MIPADHPYHIVGGPHDGEVRYFDADIDPEYGDLWRCPHCNQLHLATQRTAHRTVLEHLNPDLNLATIGQVTKGRA